MKSLKEIFGENLIELRKNKKLTQYELAERLNYSDKSISKWENGDNLPDLETLNELCKFYGVTLDYLTHPVEENKSKYILDKDENKRIFINHIMITFLVNMVVWMIATVIFVYALINGKEGNYWLAFIYAIPITCLVSALFSYGYFREYRLLFFIFWSIFIWSLLTSVFLSVLPEQIVWPIFLVGIPAQGAMVAWYLMRKRQR